MNQKFRAKRVDNGEWVYSTSIINDKGIYQLMLHTSDGVGYWVLVQARTVGRFTGIICLDGKVYEGDRLLIAGKQEVTVVYDNVVGGFTSDEEITYASWGWNETFYDHSNRVEIIGNIHD